MAGETRRREGHDRGTRGPARARVLPKRDEQHVLEREACGRRQRRRTRGAPTCASRPRRRGARRGRVRLDHEPGGEVSGVRREIAERVQHPGPVADDRAGPARPDGAPGRPRDRSRSPGGRARRRRRPDRPPPSPGRASRGRRPSSARPRALPGSSGRRRRPLGAGGGRSRARPSPPAASGRARRPASRARARGRRSRDRRTPCRRRERAPARTCP